jgi:hypothetical protein
MFKRKSKPDEDAKARERFYSAQCHSCYNGDICKHRQDVLTLVHMVDIEFFCHLYKGENGAQDV